MYDAAREGDIFQVKSLLLTHESLDVNWRNDAGWSALHTASLNGHDSILQLLLAHPAIDVNVRDDDGDRPFLVAFFAGNLPCILVLLRDSRVDINSPNRFGRIPLHWAAANGYMELLRWMIASGKDLDLGAVGSRELRLQPRRGPGSSMRLCTCSTALRRIPWRPGKKLEGISALLVPKLHFHLSEC